MSTLAILQEVREIFGAIADPDAPWDGSLKEWYVFFERKLEEEDPVSEKAPHFESSAGALHWIKQKHGSAKMQAHRAFLKMVRKDPAAHRQKMRSDAKYHRQHKWHDKIMRRTARKGYRRVHASIENLRAFLGERDPGQAFMDLPFELRVTEGDPTEKQRQKLAKAASKKYGKDVPTHYLKTCSMDSFYKNVIYFRKVKKYELQQAIAASYSALKKSCGVTGKGKMTPSEIVKAGGVAEARPGPHQNPWPQRKSKADEFVQSIDTLVRVMDFSPTTTSLLKKTSAAMKKGDKAQVKRLWKALADGGEVSAGLVNEIDHWLKGWMD